MARKQRTKGANRNGRAREGRQVLEGRSGRHPGKLGSPHSYTWDLYWPAGPAAQERPQRLLCPWGL